MFLTCLKHNFLYILKYHRQRFFFFSFCNSGRLIRRDHNARQDKYRALVRSCESNESTTWTGTMKMEECSGIGDWTTRPELSEKYFLIIPVFKFNKNIKKKILEVAPGYIARAIIETSRSEIYNKTIYN